MNLGSFSLVFAAIAFFVYGIAFLFFPSLMTSFVGIDLPVSSAVIDIRASYGGSILGIAFFFALSALQNKYLRSGLIAQVAILSGFILGRVIGIFADREPIFSFTFC